jgi:hypothetical protein
MKEAFLAIICFFLFGTLASAQDVTPDMKTTFLEKVKTAAAAKDFKAFSALYCQDGTIDPAMKDQLDKFYQGLFNMLGAMAVVDYAFAAPPANQPTSFLHNGKTYQPNLPIVALLQFHNPAVGGVVNGPGTWSLPLGIKDGSLMIVQTVLKP